jgi:hypothetical protein
LSVIHHSVHAGPFIWKRRHPRCRFTFLSLD